MIKNTIFFLALVFLAFCTKGQTLIKSYNAINDFARLGNVVYYAADDGVHGAELWKTDGTAAGTMMVKDIRPGINSSGVSMLTSFNGKLYFSASEGINGAEVWQSDGTAAGTMMLKKIGSGNVGSQPSGFTVLNNTLYFAAAADGTYLKLWKTDGTAAGTMQVSAQGDNSSVSALTAVGSSLYFVKNGNSLYQSDGTTAGTKHIAVDNYYAIRMLKNVNGKLVFITSYDLTQNNIRLYELDPAATTPVLLHAFQVTGSTDNVIGNITAAQAGFYFSIETINSFTANDALWKSDGTTAGTVSVSNYNWTNFEQGGTGMQGFIYFNNKLYFAGTNDHTIWTSDGTSAGTMQVDPANMDGSPVLSGNKYFFSSHNQLWSFNGSKAVAEVTQVTPANIFDDRGTIYFTASVPGAFQLWNNVSSGQLAVTLGNQQLTNQGTSTFTSSSLGSQTQQVTLQNIGNRELVFSGISVAGNSFYVNGLLSRSLPAGQHAVFNLTYNPTRQGNDEAVLQIKSTSSNGQEEFIQQLAGTSSGTAVSTGPNSDILSKSIVFLDGLPDFTLSHDTIIESAPAGTMIGGFQVASSGGYTFSLVSGAGDIDNSSFNLVNGQLLLAAALNYNLKSTYSIRVQALSGADTLRKIFTVSVATTQASFAGGTCAPVFQSLRYRLNDATYNGSRIIATGTDATLLVSDDDGSQWKKIETGVGAHFSHLRFADPKTGYLLGSDNSILKTEDNGDSWFPIIVPDNSYPGISSFSFPLPAIGYVIGSGGIFKTIDGGRSWSKVADALPQITMEDIAFTDADNGFICGTKGTLIHTADGGKSWQSITFTAANPSETLTHIVFADKKVGFITTTQGDLIKTTDGGKTWAVTGNPQAIIARLFFTSELDGYALAASDGLNYYKTIDGGATWTTETPGVAGTYTALAINAGGSKLCLVGRTDGGSFITLKTGAVWETRSANSSYAYVGGNLFTGGTGYVMGGQNLKTVDGGITWTDLNITTDIGDAVSNASFLSTDTGFYSTLHTIFKTTNGGATWSVIRSDPSAAIRKFYFYDARTAFYNDDQYVYRTADGGTTWSQSLVAGSTVLFSSFSFLSGQNIYAVANNNFLYRTTDGGSTWTKSDMGTNNILNSVYFIDAQNGFIGGVSGLLMRTTDGGATWNNVATSYSYNFAAFRFSDKQHGYALGKNYGGINEIYETLDGGQSWTMILQSDNDLRAFNMNDGQLFVAGAGGTILHLSSAGSPPANAGYIKGDTVIIAHNQVIYSVPSTPGTNYQWTFTGSATAEYHQNSLYISWPQNGSYQLTVTPGNSCGTGIARSVTIQVVDIPDPIVTGPDTVFAGAAHAPYTTPLKANEIFTWSSTGGTVQSQINNNAKVKWGAAGNATVNVVVTDTLLNIHKSGLLKVLIIPPPANIPDGDLKVSVTGCTCKGSNNGTLLVTASQPMSYTATITGPGFLKNYNFTDSLRIGQLVPGTYSACIRLASDTGIHRCYDLNVTEPKDLSLYSLVNVRTGMLTLDLSGADNYHIELNGRSYSTGDGSFSLPLSSGTNKLKVYTDKLCQGVIEKIIDFHIIKLYPNPFTDHLAIDLGGSPQTTAHITIASASGKVLYTSQLANSSGTLNIDIPGLMPGAYVLSLTLGQASSVFKIVKQ
jgi:ELWxxDGT repeat protein